MLPVFTNIYSYLQNYIVNNDINTLNRVRLDTDIDHLKVMSCTISW